MFTGLKGIHVAGATRLSNWRGSNIKNVEMGAVSIFPQSSRPPELHVVLIRSIERRTDTIFLGLTRRQIDSYDRQKKTVLPYESIFENVYARRWICLAGIW